jgi:hypothetical protein
MLFGKCFVKFRLSFEDAQQIVGNGGFMRCINWPADMYVRCTFGKPWELHSAEGITENYTLSKVDIKSSQWIAIFAEVINPTAKAGGLSFNLYAASGVAEDNRLIGEV